MNAPRRPDLPKSQLTVGHVSRFAARRVARRRPTRPMPRLVRIECEKLEFLVRAADGSYVQPWLLSITDVERRSLLAAEAHAIEPTDDVVLARLKTLARAQLPAARKPRVRP